MKLNDLNQARHVDADERKKEIILLTAVLVLFIALAAVLSGQEIVLNRSDHFTRWYAAYNLVHQGRSIYDFENAREVVEINDGPFEPVEGSFFYPGHLLVLVLPLVYMPYQTAHFVWLAAIQLFLLAGIWALMRLANWPESVNGRTVFLLLGILFLPNLQNTIWGQFNTIAPFFLALCYWALLRDKYFWAGIWLVGLTFKPQGMLLTLAFILVWALFKRERRPLLAGFALACVLLWAFAELFEPGWVGSFLEGLIAYSRFHAPPSAIDLLGLPAMVVEGLLLVGAAALFYRARHSSPDALLFRAGLLLSLAIWWLVTPVLGMMHLAALPAAVILLFQSLKSTRPALYRWGVYLFAALYILGLAGFLYGLSSPELYGLHIWLAEVAYKVGMTVFMLILTLPLFALAADQGDDLV